MSARWGKWTGRSCNGACPATCCCTRQHDERVPTTPTISSIIAGIQVQEAVKLLHRMPTLAGKGYIFEGVQHTSYVVEYTENPQCSSHYIMDHVVELAQSSRALTHDQLWQCAAADLNTDEVVIDFSRDIIYKPVCPTCSTEQETVPVGGLSYSQGKCVRDGSMRIVQTISGYRREPELAQARSISLACPCLTSLPPVRYEAEFSSAWQVMSSRYWDLEPGAAMSNLSFRDRQRSYALHSPACPQQHDHRSLRRIDRRPAQRSGQDPRSFQALNASQAGTQ